MNERKTASAWELLDAFGDVDDSFLAEVEAQPEVRKRRSRVRPRWLAAACIAAAVTVGASLAVGLSFEHGTVATSLPAVLAGSSVPSVAPSVEPSVAPSVEPSVGSSVEPSIESSVEPSVEPPVEPAVEFLMSGYTANPFQPLAADETFLASQREFAYALFRAAVTRRTDGGDVAVSPLSTEWALALAANGADEPEELTELFGETSLPRLNRLLRTLKERLTADGALSLDAGLWFDEPVGVYKDFLQTNADFFGAVAYKGPFRGKDAGAQTAKRLSGWAGVPMELPESGVALYGKMAFSGTWETPFLRADEVVDGVFRAADGTERAVQYLSQERRMPYLIGDGFCGGVLSYAEGYDFVLLQPWEGRWADVYDFASALTPSAVAEAVAECSSSWVDLKVPKFTAHAETSLPGVLSELGVEKLFGAGALSAMVSGDASLSTAVQTLSVSVGELGTEALAADRLVPVDSPVSVSGTSPVVSEPEWLHLESPFVYLIVERETDLPVVMGIYAGN